MKKEKIAFFLMLVSIIFSACSNKEDIENSFKIAVTPTSLTLKMGETAMISVNNAPEDAEILWKSSNENVAKVDNGKVEALEKGTAKITVIAKKGDISSEAQCDVTVEVNPLYESINFTDAYLKQRLLDIPGLDANKDSNISVKEAQTIHKLNFSYAVGETTTDENTIKSLEGLQYFVNLDTLTLNYHKVSDATPISKLDKLSQLHIGGNLIKSLDVSSLKELRDLRVFKCEIEELNLAKNSKLQILDIHNTNIRRLDFTPLKELITVVARATKLTSVNLTDMPKLTGIDLRQGVLEEFTAKNLPQIEKLYIEQNQISRLELNNLPELQHLVAYENKITKINFDLPKLMFLTVYDNKISQADFSKMPMLFRCYISNNLLKKIDFSSNKLIAQLEILQMPNLEVINLKNDNFMDAHEYDILYNNPNLNRIHVDAGEEETYVRELITNFPNITIDTN
ncbi:Ig-like domain-containing protein [Prevotella intermedia]|uniref:BIG2 domain-containing protein n=1 Tax=Prevotella intermedia TaxID=28131 RepID=A0A2M8TW88_PREIN|nr:Ig-like domain-containing protein [Prevotella intermedia]PJI28203.1 hypothetical protein CTM58_09050 [Prevotella intermedia]